MKRFYILANPEYFKKTMNWDMKSGEIKYTEDNLVAFIANDYVPVTNIIEPYYCGWQDTDAKSNETVYTPYLFTSAKEIIENE